MGKADQAVESIREILDLVKEVPIKGPVQNYDPINYDDLFADKYGGFGDNGGRGGGGGGGNFRDGGGRFDRRGGGDDRGFDRRDGGRRNDRRDNGGGGGGGGGMCFFEQFLFSIGCCKYFFLYRWRWPTWNERS